MQTDLFEADANGSNAPEILPPGFGLWRAALDRAAQMALLDDINKIIHSAPPYRPTMRNGTPMVNRLTNCGPLGWTSDKKGYRYVDCHPETQRPWPPIPKRLSNLADRLTREIGIANYQPDACLVNLYEAEGRLSLHQDYDEVDFAWPIISISLGASCRFVLGGLARQDPTIRLDLHSGDVVCLHGPSRKRFHGVAKVCAGSNPLQHPAFDPWVRINLTLRRAR
jgi:DNA oxidative demethylase